MWHGCGNANREVEWLIELESSVHIPRSSLLGKRKCHTPTTKYTSCMSPCVTGGFLQGTQQQNEESATKRGHMCPGIAEACLGHRKADGCRRMNGEASAKVVNRGGGGGLPLREMVQRASRRLAEGQIPIPMIDMWQDVLICECASWQTQILRVRPHRHKCVMAGPARRSKG